MTKLTDDELLDELRLRFRLNKKNCTELKKLNDELVKVNSKLEESESLKSHFISNITNEIVNPFSSIIGLSSEILKSKDIKIEKVKYLMSLIHTEMFHLDFQLKNIFAAAKIEAGVSQPEYVKANLSDVINDVFDVFSIESERRNIRLRSDIEESLDLFVTDAKKLIHILSNLMSNSLKFSPDETTITISCRKLDNGISVKVMDEGIGISKSNQKLIFDRFKRLEEDINSVSRGHGLGLSVVKSFMEILGGTIALDSSVNEGTKIELIIPDSNEEVSVVYDEDDFLFDADGVF